MKRFAAVFASSSLWWGPSVAHEGQDERARRGGGDAGRQARHRNAPLGAHDDHFPLLIHERRRARVPDADDAGRKAPGRVFCILCLLCQRIEVNHALGRAVFRGKLHCRDNISKGARDTR